MPVPLQVEAALAHPVQAGEGGVELLVEVLGIAGAVALDEAVAGAVPLAADVDGIVELRGPDRRQTARLQDLVDQALTGCGDDLFLGRRQVIRPRLPHPLTPRHGWSLRLFSRLAAAIFTLCLFQGNSSQFNAPSPQSLLGKLFDLDVWEAKPDHAWPHD